VVKSKNKVDDQVKGDNVLYETVQGDILSGVCEWLMGRTPTGDGRLQVTQQSGRRQWRRFHAAAAAAAA